MLEGIITPGDRLDLSNLALVCLQQGMSATTLDLIAMAFTEAAREIRAAGLEGIHHA